jgi:hypothetical protein
MEQPMNLVQLKQHLFPPEVQAALPALYSQEKVEDPIVHVKFFVPWNNWTWYATECSKTEEDETDGEDFRFFGLVDGHEKELGYWLLSDLMSVTGPGGLTIERDLHFHPQPLSKFK